MTGNAGVGDPAPKSPITSTKPGNSGEVGVALRNAFQATVEETVPQELLDLLSRLD